MKKELLNINDVQNLPEGYYGIPELGEKITDKINEFYFFEGYLFGPVYPDDLSSEERIRLQYICQWVVRNKKAILPLSNFTPESLKRKENARAFDIMRLLKDKDCGLLDVKV